MACPFSNLLLEKPNDKSCVIYWELKGLFLAHLFHRSAAQSRGAFHQENRPKSKTQFAQSLSSQRTRNGQQLALSRLLTANTPARAPAKLYFARIWNALKLTFRISVKRLYVENPDTFELTRNPFKRMFSHAGDWRCSIKCFAH